MRNARRLAMALAVLPWLLAAPSPARGGEEPSTGAWKEAALRAYAEQDASAAFESLEAGADPVAATRRYGELALTLFRERHDVAGTVLAARAGIDYALHRARAVDASDADLAARLRGEAKTIAYDLGANLWPGWAEKGVALGPTEIAIGLDAARLDVRLGQRLGRPPGAMANAHWLLGAHLLAARSHGLAATRFADAARRFEEAKQLESVAMARAYEALALHRGTPGDDARRLAYEVRLKELEALGTEDAGFYADQVRTAAAVFAK